MAKSIVFDFDNTLWRNSGASDLVMLELLRRFDVLGDDATILAYMRDCCSDRELLRHFFSGRTFRKVYQEVIANNIQAIKDGWFSPSVPRVLVKLSHKYDLYVYSGRDRSSLLYGLDQMRLRSLFKDISWDRPFLRAKPYPDGLLFLAHRHGIRPSEIVYVGDKDSDYLASHSGGCHFVGACWYHNVLTVNVAHCYNPDELEAKVSGIFDGSAT